MRQDLPDDQPVLVLEGAFERFAQRRDLLAQLPAREVSVAAARG